MKLFRRLSRIMEEEHPFTDPACSRAMLVRLLSTNDNIWPMLFVKVPVLPWRPIFRIGG